MDPEDFLDFLELKREVETVKDEDLIPLEEFWEKHKLQRALRHSEGATRGPNYPTTDKLPKARCWSGCKSARLRLASPLLPLPALHYRRGHTYSLKR